MPRRAGRRCPAAIASRRLPVTLTGQLILFDTVSARLYGFAWRPAALRMPELVAIALLMLDVTWSVRLHATPGAAPVVA